MSKIDIYKAIAEEIKGVVLKKMGRATSDAILGDLRNDLRHLVDLLDTNELNKQKTNTETLQKVVGGIIYKHLSDLTPSIIKTEPTFYLAIERGAGEDHQFPNKIKHGIRFFNPTDNADQEAKTNEKDSKNNQSICIRGVSDEKAECLKKWLRNYNKKHHESDDEIIHSQQGFDDFLQYIQTLGLGQDIWPKDHGGIATSTVWSDGDQKGKRSVNDVATSTGLGQPDPKTELEKPVYAIFFDTHKTIQLIADVSHSGGGQTYSNGFYITFGADGSVKGINKSAFEAGYVKADVLGTRLEALMLKPEEAAISLSKAAAAKPDDFLNLKEAWESNQP